MNPILKTIADNHRAAVDGFLQREHAVIESLAGVRLGLKIHAFAVQLPISVAGGVEPFRLC